MWDLVSSKLGGGKVGSRRARRTARARLGLEALEGRSTPAVFTVNSTEDGADYAPGDGVALVAPPQVGVMPKTTLRAAIMEANQLPGNDTIQINLPMNSTIPIPQDPLPELISNITIFGPSPTLQSVTIARTAAADFRIFDVAPVADVILGGLGITGGRSPGPADALTSGGGIANEGNLWIAYCGIWDNFAKGTGGGIFNKGNLSIHHTSIWLNRAANDGGGIYSEGASGIVSLG